MAVRDILDLTGASGAVYRFLRHQEGADLSPIGGNFVLVRDGIGGPRVVYCGQAESLRTGSDGPWRAALNEAGETLLYTRLNVSQRTREHEHSDVVAAYLPAANDPPPAA